MRTSVLIGYQESGYPAKEPGYPENRNIFVINTQPTRLEIQPNVEIMPVIQTAVNQKILLVASTLGRNFTNSASKSLAG